ncbi:MULTISPECIES: helix-turn-helix transcriptional regulator [Geobacillus]|uniref:Predicted transcription regulator n=1 Tax=Bacillus phage 1 TaxID=2785079 RepID=B3RH39_9CAUD|nr:MULTISPECIES: helix-turn-helix transcriptional regulator [Geobacillus]YP_010579125.1 predicted transcription regulator [Bacillus phage 1]ACE78285.1 predicted transcription regulator [Bacillus phage 1]ATA61192.1 Transcriptional regulator xre family [Geobacillus stearothermophilus]KMY60137.1 hypothetical protein AA906_07105 [Geobacillus stearothermophilus]KQB92146.1 hypothetical protein GEPA3_2926 [Geobacillus sp. PA-3]MED3782839.1 helix-turn-helix transcriptional regulator [Geobacillus stea
MKNCLRDVRRSFDITQEELAKAVGTTRQTIHKIERGKLKRAPSYELMYAIAQFFGKKVEDIFFTQVVTHELQEKKTAG